MRVHIATQKKLLSRNEPSRQLVYRPVVALKFGQEPVLKLFPIDLRTAQTGVEDIPSKVAERLEVFVRRHYINRRQGYNCFTFALFLTGFDHRSSGFGRNFVPFGDEVSPQSLVPYRPYIMTQSKEPVHGVLGFAPNLCLSVIGDNGPLAITRTAALMEWYSADHIYQLNKVIHL